MRHNNTYIVGFAAVVCLVCSVFVATSAVSLRARQEVNRVLDRQKKVLTVAGLIEEGQDIQPQRVQELFDLNIQAKVVELSSGEPDPEVDPAAFDQQKAQNDPARSRAAPPNAAGVRRLPNDALVYLLKSEDEVAKIILPIEGKGLWSTLYGYLALAPDTTTIEGIIFYEHGETPGLGAEIDNPSWKALWQGRQAFDEDWDPAITVIKGHAGPPDTDPYRVDGLSGSTITARGVSELVRFWLGEDGFGPYLERFRSERSQA
jgi:Na+-transporting NADH:ubiquinone oxidoreductase subunit C